jgi:DNA mismatch repair protein MutS2
MTDIHPDKPTPDAFEHAIEALELEDVLGHVAAKCTNEGAREAIRSLKPTTDRAAIADRIGDIREICDYHEDNGRIPMVDTSVGCWVSSARDSRETISPEALLAIAVAERSVRDLRRAFRELGERYPRLHGIVTQMTPHGELIDSVEHCLERDGTIRDKASHRLADLRRRIARAKSEIRRHTDGLAKSLGGSEYATFTGSRYLLLVPRDKCQRREGIVHSTSHSGESLYFEPFSLVERNNALETLSIDERAEEARILSELSVGVVAVGDELLANMALWERLDTLNAIADFSHQLSCTLPDASPNGDIRIVTARHPLLELSLRDANHAERLVPLDFRLREGSRVMVITGPNAGGKTVTLKTVGLLTLMFQCGLPVPCAEGTELAVFDRVFADIGDEQSISSSLSTFTSHLRHLDSMCREANERTLCLIDEIGDGTDPDEGSALAIAALEHLLGRSSAVVATTHYGKVKSFALRTDGVENASMVFDDDNDRPLYRLLQGTAGRSRGLETARRLDFFEPVIRDAQSMLGKDAFRLEALLSELESERLALERERGTVESQSWELRRLIASYDEQERDIREHKRDHKARAKKEAEDILLRARKEIEAIVKEIRESNAARATVRDAHDRLGKLLDTARQTEESRRDTVERVREVSLGDRVSLNPSGEPSGRVVGVKRDDVTVEIKGKKINVKKSNLYSTRGDADETESVGVDVSVEPLRSTTIDVRGKDREEALADVDLFLDRAVLNGVGEVTIIHGVGEEILLGAIRSHLREDSRVQSVRAGGLGEGGRGVSVVQLR